MVRTTSLLGALMLCLAAQASTADEGPRADRSAPETHQAEVFDFPLVSIFHHRHVGEYAQTRVVDVPLFSLYRSERFEDGQYDIRIVDLPLLGSLFRLRRTEDEDRTDALFVIRLRRARS